MTQAWSPAAATRSSLAASLRIAQGRSCRGLVAATNTIGLRIRLAGRARFSSTALVGDRGNDTSTPTSYGYQEVLVKGFVQEVAIILCRGAEIARHARFYGQGRATSFTTRCTIRRSRQCRNSARAGTAGARGDSART